MASRSNTALHVAVILLILLVVVLGVTTYVFWSGGQQAVAEKETADNSRDAAVASKNSTEKAYDLLKVVIGKQRYNPEELERLRTDLQNDDPTLWAEIEAIETKFKQDMQSFPASYPDTKDYTTLHVVLFQMLKDTNASLADAQQRENDLIAQIDQIKTSEAAKVTAADTAKQTALTDKANSESQSATELAKLRSQNDALAAEVAKKGKDYKELYDNSLQEKKALEAEMVVLETTIKNQQTALAAMTTTDFVRPDGRIVNVSQEQRRVWIDLGEKDGLRRQQTFSVYDQGETDFQNAKPKGTIEITAITGPSMAEARINSDSIGDPLLYGDLIFTPAWQPGQRLHFALAGLLDINKDRKSDAERIKAVISQNGGIVDAEVNEQGVRTGKITIETRYLVVGERPTDTSDPATVAAYSNLIKECETYGIDKITIDKLLSMMGYRPEVITTPLGGSAPGGGGGFRERKPASAFGP